MRTLVIRITSTVVIVAILAACASPAVSPSGSPSPLVTAGTSPSPSDAGPPQSSAATPAASRRPADAVASLPVRGSAMAFPGQVQLVVGPAGDLVVGILTDADGSVIALLDGSGAPKPGWPKAMDAICYLSSPGAADAIKMICSRTFDPLARAVAFESDGLRVAGWPVDLPASPARAESVVADGTTYVLASDPNDDSQDQLLAIATDATVRVGTPFQVPDPGEQDGVWQLGPAGTGYLLAYANDAPHTFIWAIDLDGVRPDWSVDVSGRPSGLAFGPDGRIYVTEGGSDRPSSRILVFDGDGRPLPIGSDQLPVTATGTYSGAGPFDGAPPPIVARDGTAYLVSEDGGTTVYGLDPSGQVIDGWPYRDTVGLQWSVTPGFDTGTPGYRSEPAVGPDGTLYLLHAARDESVGGSIVAIGPDGRVRPGWPIELTRPGAVFWSVEVGDHGTAYALAIEPESGSESSASVLAIAPDSTVLWTTTIIEP